MSSILDALNKLEQEKAQAARDNEQAELDPAMTAHDLVGRNVLRDRVTLRVTPAALLLSIGAFIATVAVVVIAVALIFSRSGEKPAGQTAVAENVPAVLPPAPAATEVKAPPTAAPEISPAQEPAAVAVVPPQSSPATALATTPDSNPAPAQQPLPSPQASSFIPKPETAAPSPGPVSSPAVVARQPEPKAEPPAPAPEVNTEPKESPAIVQAPKPEPVAEVRPAPAESELVIEDVPASRTRVAAAPIDDEEELPPRSATVPRRTPPAPKATAAPAKDVAVDRLPEFTPVDQMRYGFDRVTINIMKPADATNPRGSAIISFSETSEDGSKRQNRMRFFEGERLQQSPLRMFKVEKDRVGIEDVRTGDRYQLQF